MLVTLMQFAERTYGKSEIGPVDVEIIGLTAIIQYII